MKTFRRGRWLQTRLEPAAKAGFPAWSVVSFSERRKKIEAIADAPETRANEFARLLTQEQGKPITVAGEPSKPWAGPTPPR